MVVYKNGAQDIAYHETLDFSKLEGMSLCKPETGEEYEVKLESGQEKIVVIRQDR